MLFPLPCRHGGCAWGASPRAGILVTGQPVHSCHPSLKSFPLSQRFASQPLLKIPAKDAARAYKSSSTSDFHVGNFPSILFRFVSRCALGFRCLVFAGRCCMAAGLVARFLSVQAPSNQAGACSVCCIESWWLCMGRLRARRMPRTGLPTCVQPPPFVW